MHPAAERRLVKLPHLRRTPHRLKWCCIHKVAGRQGPLLAIRQITADCRRPSAVRHMHADTGRAARFLMARRLLALPACLALLLVAVPAARGAPRVGVAASAGRTFAAAARSVDAGGSLTVTGEGAASRGLTEKKRS